MLVALELDDGIDDMLEDLRSGKGAFLGDMADEDDRYTTGLRLNILSL